MAEIDHDHMWHRFKLTYYRFVGYVGVTTGTGYAVRYRLSRCLVCGQSRWENCDG